MVARYYVYYKLSYHDIEIFAMKRINIDYFTSHCIKKSPNNKFLTN